MVAAELVDERNIDDEVGISSDVGALDGQVAMSGLTIPFHDGRDVASFRQQSSLVAEGFQRVKHDFVGGLGAASVLVAEVHMVDVHVDDGRKRSLVLKYKES